MVDYQNITPEMVESKCQLMQRTHTTITCKSVARCLGVSDSWLKRRPVLAEVVDKYRTPTSGGARVTREQLEAIKSEKQKEAIAYEPPIKAWVDPTYATWKPSMQQAIQARERLKRSVANRWHDDHA